MRIAADDGCNFVSPEVLDMWPAVEGTNALVIVGRPTKVDEPESAMTAYGEYLVQRLHIVDAETIIGSRAGATTEYEVLLPLSRAEAPNESLVLGFGPNELVDADAVVLNASWSASAPLIASAATVNEDGKVQFVGRCANGLNEAMASLMSNSAASGRSEVDVLGDWLRQHFGATGA